VPNDLAHVFGPEGSPIDIGTLMPGGSFTTIFEPPDPCFADALCGLAFSFSGLSGPYSAFAFNTVDLPNTPPNSPPVIALGVFDPAFPPDPIRGNIVAFDDPNIIGTWEVTVSAVPEPGSAALLAPGFVLVLGWWLMRRARLLLHSGPSLRTLVPQLSIRPRVNFGPVASRVSSIPVAPSRTSRQVSGTRCDKEPACPSRS
jgi:hypothetical protein